MTNNLLINTHRRFSLARFEPAVCVVDHNKHRLIHVTGNLGPYSVTINIVSDEFPFVAIAGATILVAVAAFLGRRRKRRAK